MFVRHHAMDREQATGAEQYTKADERRTQIAIGREFICLVERRQQQREEGGGEHDARRGAQHAVLGAVAGTMNEEDSERAERSAEAGEQAAEESKPEDAE